MLPQKLFGFTDNYSDTQGEKKIPEMLAKMYGCGDVKELIRLFETGSADIEELLARSVSLKLALNLFISE